jgi:hypothetical protein
MASVDRKNTGRKSRRSETRTKPAGPDRPATDGEAKRREGYMHAGHTKSPTQGRGDERGRAKDTGRTGA